MILGYLITKFGVALFLQIFHLQILTRDYMTKCSYLENYVVTFLHNIFSNVHTHLSDRNQKHICMEGPTIGFSDAHLS